MINLLPAEAKENVLYARRNTRLLHWLVYGVIVVVGISFVTLAGHLYIGRSISNYQDNADRLQAELKVQNVDATEKQIKTISSDIKLVVQVLSQEVLFSKLLTQIGSVMPPQSVLSGIDISNLGGGIDLTAQAVDYKTATQVQVNLQDPSNKIFSKVDIISITCGSAAATPYPCDVNLRASFVNNNPFLFINNGAGARP